MSCAGGGVSDREERVDAGPVGAEPFPRPHEQRHGGLRQGPIILHSRVEVAERNRRQLFDIRALRHRDFLEGLGSLETQRVGRVHLGSGRVGLKIMPSRLLGKIQCIHRAPARNLHLHRDRVSRRQVRRPRC